MSLELKFVHLFRSDFNINKTAIKEKAYYGLALTDYDRHDKKDGDGFDIIVFLEFDLMFEVKDPVFDLNCRLGLYYKAASQQDLDTLKDHIIVAHAIPYLREFVANLTMRTPLSPLYLSPVNAHELWGRYEKMSKVKEKTKTTISNKSTQKAVPKKK